MAQHIVASAPGKVLLAGGYTVLEHPRIGIVVATSARFYTTAKVEYSPAAGETGTTSIQFVSPQFGTTKTYSLTEGPNPKLVGDGALAFVEHALRAALVLAESENPNCLNAIRGHSLSTAGPNSDIVIRFTVQGDNDFYSQQQQLKDRGLPLTRAALRTLPPFLPCPKGPDGKPIVNKTGLGSSAALTTSIVAAAYAVFSGMSATEATARGNDFKERVHAAAQVAHCLAQGKVGSGFDVYSATFGSSVYRRIPEEALAIAMNNWIPRDVNSLINQMHTGSSPLIFPRHLHLIMADIAGGSETPSMVRKILQWKREGGEQAESLWKHLDESNRKVKDALEHLLHVQHTFDKLPLIARACSIKSASALAAIAAALAAAIVRPNLNAGPIKDAIKWLAPALGLGGLTALLHARVHEKRNLESQARSSYDKWIYACAAETKNKWQHHTAPVPAALSQLSSALKTSRTLLKLIGDRAGVPVEPQEQTEIADATEQLPGVIACGVPGAGGFDALYALVVTKEAEKAVEELWTSRKWRVGTVMPLQLTEDTKSTGLGSPSGGLIMSDDLQQAC